MSFTVLFDSGGIQTFPKKNHFPLHSLGTLIHKLSSIFFVLDHLYLCHTSIIGPLIGTLLPPTPNSCYPFPSFFHLIMRNLQLCVLFVPLYLGRAYSRVRLFLAVCALPWRFYTRSMIIFSASFFDSLSSLLLSIVRCPSLLLLCSLLAFFLCLCLLYTTGVLSRSL